MKIKGIVFILFAACVGHIGAMDSDKGTAEERLQRLIEEKFPMELHFDILEQMMELPFPTSNQGDFAQRYLNYLMSRDVDLNLKKQYLNKFAKKWYLTYGRELKLPATWIKKHFPGQTQKQVLDYGFSIQDYLDSPILKEKIHLTSQTDLDLSNMKINNLYGLQNIPNINTVQTLYLHHNQLEDIPTNAFAGLTNLEWISLSGNQLSTIQPNAFAGLPNLVWLYLSNNRLTTIQPEAFAGLTNLKRLLLNENQLRTIQAKAFTGLTNLEELFLDNNQMTIIKQPKAFAGLTKLYRFDLYDNQLDKKTEDALRKALQANINLYIMF